jgi:hypothetical protein
VVKEPVLSVGSKRGPEQTPLEQATKEPVRLSKPEMIKER